MDVHFLESLKSLLIPLGHSYKDTSVKSGEMPQFNLNLCFKITHAVIDYEELVIRLLTQF